MHAPSSIAVVFNAKSLTERAKRDLQKYNDECTTSAAVAALDRVHHISSQTTKSRSVKPKLSLRRMFGPSSRKRIGGSGGGDAQGTPGSAPAAADKSSADKQ